ncbi:hypothetical protein NDU88_009517 [Pleurodeles waltl]|uniref:Uncharacterized protein n=1 Tax=Pleurodeles waltl TaxID=8319 RepID=A0AAV7QRT7_PLEWA|nr:hypothetical protein NDU88_009517 [Pleurodeles waltl]
MRVMSYGESDSGGKAGMAQVRLDFWQPGTAGLQAGCDSFSALGVPGEQATSLRLGQLAEDSSGGTGTLSTLARSDGAFRSDLLDIKGINWSSSLRATEGYHGRAIYQPEHGEFFANLWT